MAAGPVGSDELAASPRPVSRALCPLPRHHGRRRRPDRDDSSIPIPATIARACSSSNHLRSGFEPTHDDLQQDRARWYSRHGDAVVCAARRTEVEALVYYVKYLSIRGEMETVAC